MKIKEAERLIRVMFDYFNSPENQSLLGGRDYPKKLDIYDVQALIYLFARSKKGMIPTTSRLRKYLVRSKADRKELREFIMRNRKI